MKLAPSRRRLLLALWLALTLFQLVRLFAQGVARAGATREPFAVPVRIDLNHARPAELALLPGIGPGRAEAIVLHRVRHGPFRRFEDLLAVDGIGERTVAGLADFAELGLAAPVR